VIGGGFYFRHELGLQKSDQKAAAPLTTPASQSVSNDSTSSSIAQPLAPQGTQHTSNPNSAVPTVTIPGTTVTVSANPVSTGASTSSVAPSSAPAAAPKPRGPSVTSDMLASTLNAHPVSSTRADTAQPNDAPSVDANTAGSDVESPLPGLASSSSVASPPPPVAVPEGPVKVGGEVREPRLLTFRQPDYPPVAKQAHIQGDVVVSTQIDKLGNVVRVQVISGPNMLRQPALDALRRWKYSPSTLNGQPVSVEIQVTVKFRM
jgi:protein TonB